VSQANVDFVSGLYAAGSLDKQQLLAALPELIRQACDPEIEWVEDPDRADGRTYRGHDGVLESFQQWLDQFSEYGFEAERIIDCGDDVLVVGREQGRGAASGAPVTAAIYQVLTIKDGKVLRFQEFYDQAPALRAVGLSELPRSSLA
jgi:ketosteroid isomerase-like protein